MIGWERKWAKNINDLAFINGTPLPRLCQIGRVPVMFRDAWTQRLAQFEDIVKSGKSQIKAIEKQVDALLVRSVTPIIVVPSRPAQ